MFHQFVSGQIAISVNGSWNQNISSSEISDAGEDFIGTYESFDDQVQIDIFQQFFWLNLFNYDWQVSIRKEDIDWNTNLLLEARRTGNGNPFLIQSIIDGGLTYNEIISIDQLFFWGNRTTLNIPIQYKISGISLLLPATTLTTNIVYTVTEP